MVALRGCQRRCVYLRERERENRGAKWKSSSAFILFASAVALVFTPLCFVFALLLFCFGLTSWFCEGDSE